MAQHIAAITKSGIPVFGHIDLTPQSAVASGGVSRGWSRERGRPKGAGGGPRGAGGTQSLYFLKRFPQHSHRR